MPDTYQLSSASLDLLFAALTADGRRILAPTDRDGRSELNLVSRPDQVARDYVQTTLSAKETVFPKVEQLLSYTLKPGAVDLVDAVPKARPTVLFGIRPCEASAFAALDAVFNWDYRDTFFNTRLEQLAVIGMGCTRKDDACFCTSVGGGPGSTKGSDILLTPMNGGYLAEVLTDKGRAIQALAPEAFQPADGADKAAEYWRRVVGRDRQRGFGGSHRAAAVAGNSAGVTLAGGGCIAELNIGYLQICGVNTRDRASTGLKAVSQDHSALLPNIRKWRRAATRD